MLTPVRIDDGVILPRLYAAVEARLAEVVVTRRSMAASHPGAQWLLLTALVASVQLVVLQPFRLEAVELMVLRTPWIHRGAGDLGIMVEDNA